MKKAKDILARNVDIKIMSADKGDRIVIIDSCSYQKKMHEFISSNVSDGVYFHLIGVSFDYIKGVCESKFRSVVERVNEFFLTDRALFFENLRPDLTFQPYIVSRIYGLIKVNKGEYPIRPIISSTGSCGRSLEAWMLKKLELISKRIGKNQIRSARQLFAMDNGVRLREAKAMS